MAALPDAPPPEADPAALDGDDLGAPDDAPDREGARALADPAHDPPPPPAAPTVGFLDGQAPQALVAAFVAWSITVAPAAFGRGVPSSARALAFLALAAGIAGPFIGVGLPRPIRLGRGLGPRRLGRLLGISVYLAFATATWLLASAALQPARLDPTRAAIGAIAWGVFALAWSDRWSLGHSPLSDPDAPALPARATLPRAAVPIATAAVLVGVVYTALAWRVRDPDRAALAHVVATGCGVWLLAAAGTVAIARGAAAPRAPRRVTPTALRRVLVLAAVAIGGAILLALR
jgi:hypothetical protein